MSFDLSNESGGYQAFTNAGWPLALIVAEHYGWQAAGTPRPADWDDADGPWEGEYAIQAGQTVTREDAASLADALERAAASDDFVRVVQQGMDRLNAELVEAVPSARNDVRPISPEEAEQFRGRFVDLVAFARQGAFVIE